MYDQSSYIKITENWTLAGYYTFGPFVGAAMENGSLPFPCVTCKAHVPGSVTADLVAAGELENPYYEKNTLNREWIGNRHWVYTNESIIIPESMMGKRLRLIFLGVDYKAHFYFNGQRLGEHTGMFEEIVFDITDTVKFGEANTLRICLEHTPFEHSYTGYITEKSTVKTHCSYRWDFCPRMVDCGIYDEVLIAADGGVAPTYITPLWDGERLEVRYALDGSASKMKAELIYNGVCETEATAKAGDAVTLKPQNPRLWFPAGAGEQPMYCLKLTPMGENGEVLGEFCVETALRSLSYKQCPDAPADAIPYKLHVNGKYIRMNGVNLCPVDLMFGSVTDERYERLVNQIRDGGFNAVRMWGGGNLEREIFYTLCDRAGIVILHDFLQSNITNCCLPNHEPEFLSFFGGIMTNVARKLSSHPCIVMYSGGNEIRDPATGSTIGYDDPNIAMLGRIVEECSPGTLFLPTCGSGPYPLVDPDHSERYYHDVHGPWVYMGVEAAYSLWNNQRAMYNSEFGCNGMTNLSTLEKILAPDAFEIPLAEWITNPRIRHHHDGWDTYYRDSSLFGELNLKEYIAISQYLMGEGIRYALESGRRRDGENCGMLVWQMNEPWPNSACTNLVDYYGTPKLAYYMAREALAPLHASIEYDRLTAKKGDSLHVTPYIHAPEAGLSYKLTISIDGDIHTFEGITSDTPLQLDTIGYTAPEKDAYRVTLTLEIGDKRNDITYLFFTGETLSREAVFAYIKKYYSEAEAASLI
ncbi:MAG: hypothetical protein IJA85_09760 [Clostridia bacterium]|nr:hypothetical protein [Clostridia bacterium]